MQVSTQIDELIKSLQSLKPKLSENKSDNQLKFNEILDASLASSPAINNASQKEVGKNTQENFQLVNSLSHSSKKPNMREMIEAISGKSMKELYAGESTIWKKYSELAADLLYGVTGNSQDTRDWKKIMYSANIIETAQKETNKMHKPVVDIESEFNSQNTLVDQYAVLKNSSGEILRTLRGNNSHLKTVLENFAITSGSVPSDLEAKVKIPNFNNNVFDILKTVPKSDNNFELKSSEGQEIHSILLNTATDAISSQITDFHDFDKA